MATSTIAGVPISKANQAKLVDEVLRIADDLGYCDQTQTVLSELGFDIPTNKFTVTLTAEVTLERGKDINDYLGDLFVYDDYGRDGMEDIVTVKREVVRA